MLQKVAKLAFLLPPAYMAVIYLFSAQPGENLHLPAPDYIMHAIEYAGLAFMWRLALAGTWRCRGARAAWLAVALSVAWGISDEWHQSFVPGRFPAWSDVAADTIGALLAQLGIFIWQRLAGYLGRQGGRPARTK